MSDSVQLAHGAFHGLFTVQQDGDGVPRVERSSRQPSAIPDPATGRMLRVGSVDAPSKAICPSCSTAGLGGFVAFESDLRMAYACPTCEQFVWLAGA